MSSNPVDVHDLQKVLSRMANRGGGVPSLPDIQKQETRLDRMREYTNALSARGGQHTPPKTARSSKTEGHQHDPAKQTRSVSVELNCGPCMRDGLHREAVGYCIDCSEYFCDNCVKHHKNLKITKNHVVRDRKKMPKFKHPMIEDDQLEVCSLHSGELLRYFCTDHDEACCSVCATLKHRTCQELSYIPQMNMKKTKKSCSAMIKQINTLIGQFQKVKDDTNKNVHLLDMQRSDFQQTILKVHQDVLDLLHRIEKEIIGNLSYVCDSEIGYLTARMDMSDEAINVLHQASAQLQMAKQNGMENKSFLQMKKVTKQVTHYESLITDIKSKNVKPMKIAFKLDKHVKHFLRTTNQLGSLVIAEGPERNVIPLTQLKIKSRSDSVEISEITGSTVMPDGRVVLADMHNECLKLVDSSYNMISQSKLSSEPWDVCCISSEQAIISLPRERKLQFYAITNTMRPLKRIGQNDSVKGSQYYGLAYHSDNLFVTCPKDQPPNVKILDMQGRQLHKIDGNQQEQGIFNDPLYIAVKYDGKTIYVSDNGNNAIITLDVHGNNPAKTFNIPDNNTPGGVVALPDGNVYYCGLTTNSLNSLLMGEMEGSQEVKGSQGELMNPQSITYCRKERRLAVSMQKQNTVKVFQLY